MTRDVGDLIDTHYIQNVYPPIKILSFFFLLPPPTFGMVSLFFCTSFSFGSSPLLQPFKDDVPSKNNRKYKILRANHQQLGWYAAHCGYLSVLDCQPVVQERCSPLRTAKG